MSAIHTVGWALLHSLWEGALAAVALTALLAIVPSREARLRYALATATLVFMALLPLATALRFHAADPGLALAGHTLALRIRAGVEPALPWLVAAWGAGVTLCAILVGSRWRATRRLRTMGTRIVPEELQRVIARLAAQLRISRPVQLLASALVEVPAVIGWWRPVILVPVSVLTGGTLTPLQLDALLAHELAHVRRHDYLVNLLQTVVETLLFYHPVVWWVSAQVREEREHCCDDLAVAACGDARLYAGALLTMEQLRAAPSLALVANGGSLINRVRRLLVPVPGHAFPRWLAGVVVGMVVLALAIGSGAGPHPTSPLSADSLIALALDSRDPEVRHDAVKALAYATDARTRTILITLAQNDPDGDVRDEAVESLGQAFPGAETVRILATIARRDPDQHVMHEAVEVLGEMADGAGLHEVIAIARTHPNPEVRREAIESIRDSAPRTTAVPVLQEIARRDPDPAVHRKAVRALEKIDEPNLAQ